MPVMLSEALPVFVTVTVTGVLLEFTVVLGNDNEVDDKLTTGPLEVLPMYSKAPMSQPLPDERV